MTSGLALSGGHIRIVNESNQVLDQIGWGSANESIGQASAEPAAGQSLKRRVNEDAYFTNEGNNATDFIVSNTPTPFMDTPDIAPPVINTNENEAGNSGSTTNNGGTATDSSSESPVPTNPTPQAPAPVLDYSKVSIAITEVLPDPDKPLTDAEHEMIELHNMGTASVDLKGLIILTGLKGQYDFTMPSLKLAPQEYFSLYSADTNLTLANSGGRVVVAAPDGKVLSSVDYPKAKKNQSWSNVNGQWGWTAPTPNAANAKLIQESEGKPGTQDVTSNAKNTSENKDPLTKKSVDYGTQAASADSQQSASQQGGSGASGGGGTSNINTSILAGVGGLAVLYMLYEYRHEFRARVKKLGGYIKNRKAAWTKP